MSGCLSENIDEVIDGDGIDEACDGFSCIRMAGKWAVYTTVTIIFFGLYEGERVIRNVLEFSLYERNTIDFTTDIVVNVVGENNRIAVQRYVGPVLYLMY